MSFHRPRSGLIRDGGTAAVVRDGSDVGILGGRTRSEAVEELPRFYPQLEPSYQVTLALRVRNQIAGEIDAIRREFHTPMEIGGWLFSQPDNPDLIRLATPPGENSQFARGAVELDVEHAEEIERAYPHLRLRGDWHFHPDGGSAPSYTDRRAWATGARNITGEYWVGVIVTRPAGMFTEPQFHGWFTDRTFCERCG